MCPALTIVTSWRVRSSTARTNVTKRSSQPAGERRVDAVDCFDRRSLAGQAVAYLARQFGHQQCGRNSLARHVRQNDGQPIVGQLDIVVIIAADLVRRFVKVEKVVVAHARRSRRQQAPLHLVSQLQLELQRFALQCRFVHLGVVDGDAGLRGDTGQHVEVFFLKSLPLVGRVDLNDTQRGAFAVDQRGAHQRTNAQVGDALARLEANVTGGIGRKDACLLSIA